MKCRACLLVVLALSLGSCGSKDKPAKNDLTLPISAPMQARQRLLRDVDKSKDAARERERKFDSLLQQNR